MARYSFDTTTKEFTELTPDEDSALSTRSRLIGDKVVALTLQEEAELEIQEAANTAQAAAETRAYDILKRLEEIDMESVRAIRSEVIGRGVQADRDKLSSLEDEAQILRMELSSI